MGSKIHRQSDRSSVQSRPFDCGDCDNRSDPFTVRNTPETRTEAIRTSTKGVPERTFKQAQKSMRNGIKHVDFSHHQNPVPNNVFSFDE
jgi:hypothetical protein